MNEATKLKSMEHRPYKKTRILPIIVCDEWPKDSYNFETSLGVKDGCLLGMMVDEDSQSELTEERITTYVAMLKKKFNL